ncbi:POT family-domain-containing protein [Halteromyces radiatus]|uniref:POT family-domain-containing protein n=1 Tax=Halteromyces radiatus TaxID=101107 RepID=UPI0022204548|nr:POT family-domain-containing protein [Halteromyces radiatus]KAI8100120.1 POT family-domain-containing protein [Halteromyces radiatus]
MVEDENEEPTVDDWKNLREVADNIPKSAFLIILIEFCERFTFYGLSGPFQNYIQQPPPPSYPATVPGALGKGQQTATALTLFFNFWCYVTPIIGAVIADQYLGKYKTILVFACVYFVGLLILTCTSIPAAIENGSAFPGFVVALVVIGFATGGIKSNVSPLVAEQYPHNKAFIRTRANGERVIVSPQATYQKLFNMFYWGINCGSLASVATTLLEKNVGFWIAFLLPTCVFIPGIFLVIIGKKWYIQTPPRGSIFFEVASVIKLSFKLGLDGCKPSQLKLSRPDLHVTWDDVFVDELRRTFKACVVFCWYPIYWLCYSQMTNNLVSMVATTHTGSIPNDILQTLNPLTLVICIPIMDRVIYPILHRLGFPMRPMSRITCGFVFASLAMAYAAIIQHIIYTRPPYYDHPTGNKNDITAAIIVPAYILIAISEIFASITGLEYAFKKAPEKMKSLVMAMFLFTNCIGALLGFTLVSVAVDPKLQWMYTGISVAMFVCAILFYVCHSKNDATDVEEDNIVRAQTEKDIYNQKIHQEAIEEYEIGIKSTV